MKENLKHLVKIKNLRHLDYQIASSFEITKLKDNWDDDGAIPVPFDLWFKASTFLYDMACKVYEKYMVIIEAPEINAVKDGSIDLSWRLEDKYRLLININEKGYSYYGDNYNPLIYIKHESCDFEIDLELCNWMRCLEIQDN